MEALKCTFLFLIISFFSPSETLASNVTWIGGGTPFQSQAWENPQNWSSGTVPSSTDNVTITGGNISLNSNVQIKDLNFIGGHLDGLGTLTIDGVFNLGEDCFLGQTIAVIVGSNGSFIVDTPPSFNFGRSLGGDITINGTMVLRAGYFGTTGNFVVNGTLNWQYGNIYDNLTIGSSGTLNIQGNLEGYQRLVADNLTNNGTINWHHRW